MESVVDYFHEIFYLRADVRIRDKFLMGSPIGVLVIVTCYLLILKYLTRYMKSRKRYFNHAKILHLFFNFYVMMASFYILIKTVKYMIWSNYNFRCMPLDLSTNNGTMEVKYISKMCLKLS